MLAQLLTSCYHRASSVYDASAKEYLTKDPLALSNHSNHEAFPIHIVCVLRLYFMLINFAMQEVKLPAVFFIGISIVTCAVHRRGPGSDKCVAVTVKEARYPRLRRLPGTERCDYIYNHLPCRH